MTFVEFLGLGLLIAVVLCIALVVLRRSSLSRTGAVDLSWRNDPARGGWILGQARYNGDRLELFRSLSPLPVAARRLQRQTLRLGERRAPVGTEPDLLPPGSVIVRCSDAGSDLELAMSEPTLTGLRSWLESAPSSSIAHLLGGEQEF